MNEFLEGLEILKESEDHIDVDWIGILDGCFRKSALISRKQYSEALPEYLSVDQVRYALAKFEAQGLIAKEGKGKGTKYRKLKELS